MILFPRSPLPIVDDLTDHLFDSGLSSVLLLGERGSGKTTALDSLREVLQAQTIYYVQTMACKRLIGQIKITTY